jgi:hypothetical protein
MELQQFFAHYDKNRRLLLRKSLIKWDYEMITLERPCP